MTELISEDLANGTRVLTLNRPEQLNALSADLILQLGAQVTQIAESETVKCVVIRGAGRSFCTGYDLKSRERAKEVLPRNYTAGMIAALSALPQPVIASVHGHCLTGGLELALAADFIIAADNARFGDTHAKWSMRAAWGLTQRLPRRMGNAIAKDMMFSGRQLNGVEAVQLGLASRCVPDAELHDVTIAVATRICEHPPEVIRWIKMQVDTGSELPLSEALVHERENRPQGTTDTDKKLGELNWLPPKP